MASPKLSKEEIEELDYYDFTAYVGVPYFHWGGMEASMRLASLCHVSAGSRVLMVGCGTGFSACHIARSFDCHVVGVDIARLMVTHAAERARESQVADRLSLLVGDAHALPFADGSFDAVMTEFVTVFLDKERALAEYARVVKPGGYVGMNEIYRHEEVPDEARDLLHEAEEEFTHAMGLPLELAPPSRWKEWMTQKGLGPLQVEEVAAGYSLGEYSKSMGGMANMLKVVSRTLYYMSASQKLRKKLMPVGRVKDVLLKNKTTREHVGALLCVGQKPA